MIIRSKRHFSLFGTLALASCPSGPLCAAQPNTTMEPLVVTAERSSGSILLGKDLDLFQAGSVANLSGLAPNLYVVTSDTRGYGDIISMRGSANTLFFSPPAVGMMVDDVPMGETASYPTGLLDLDQVAVLRGPQGTIYGRNGAAGMLDLTTPPPGLKNEMHFTTEYGSYNAWGAKLRSGGPLGNGLSQTFQLYHQQRDGFIDNTTLGQATDDRSLSGGLANLYWKPAPDTEWRLRVLAERADDGSQRLSLLGSPDPFTVASDIPGETVMQRHQVSLHWTKDGQWGRFKSITAWQDWKLDPSVTDLDLINNPGIGMSSTIVQEQRMWSQEFRWESPQEAAPWAWRTGVFFMDQASSGDAAREFYGPYVGETTRYDLDQWNIAAYGRASYAVNPRLHLLAGARLEYVGSGIDRIKTGNASYPTPPVSEDVGDWYCSPELGAGFALTDTARLFARSAIGIKPAGFSAFASMPAQAQYAAEQAWTNEAGVEVSLPDTHLTFSLTGFWNQSADYQLNRPDTPPSTDYFTVNAGQVTSLGLETELRWQPVTGLTLLGSAGYVNAEFDSHPLAGMAVPYVPDFTASLGGRYDFPRGFYAQTSLRATGATYFDEANDDRYRQGSYFCWDAELGYARENFSLAVFGRNMLDERYYSFINSQIKAGSPGDPQTFGVRATLGF